MSFKQELNKEELREYPVSGFNGEINLIDSYDGLSEAASVLCRADTIGFDTETRPSFKKGRKNTVSLLQLSTENQAFLFRLNRIGMPAELSALLSDKSILKIGVAVHDDLKALKSLRQFEESSFIDLQDMVKKYGILSQGLSKLAAIVLGFRISKRHQVSNWESETLSEGQLRYAATDAWVCLELYNKLRNGSEN